MTITPENKRMHIRFMNEEREWLQRAIRHVHRLEQRIKKLKGKVYPGYGFHYDWVRQVRAIRTNLYQLSEDPDPEFWKYIVDRVCLEGLTKDVKRAEEYQPEPNLVPIRRSK